MPKINALPVGSSQQRQQLNHQAIEDYLKTIYELQESEVPVSTSRIAEARGVRPGSVTNMVQRLARLKLVHYEKHYGVTLTDAGTKLALEVIRHHRLLELYLMEALGFSWDEVHEQADILEHVISEQFEERIATALDNPKYDPHGAPIPTKEGAIESVETQSLDSLPAGSGGRIARIADDADSDMLRYLAGLGLVPDAAIRVNDVAPFAGPITLDVDDVECIIGHNVARAILVEVI